MKIHYLEFGQKGQTIVFLHGWQTSSQSFSPLVPFLYQDYHLFLLDLPGFGQSSSPPDNFSSFDYAKTVTKWLKQKKLKKIILLGHSFGGKVAAIIAAKQPKLISKLILIASAGLPHAKKYYRLKRYLPKRALKVISPLWQKFFASRDYRQAGKLRPIFKNIVKENLAPIFSQIKIPTLIIWGSKDKELPLQDGQKIQQLINKSRLVTIEAGHFPFWDNPQKIARLIKEFAKNEKN